MLLDHERMDRVINLAFVGSLPFDKFSCTFLRNSSKFYKQNEGVTNNNNYLLLLKICV